MFGTIFLAMVFAIITWVIDMFINQNNRPEHKLLFSCIVYFLSIIFILAISTAIYDYSDLSYLFICCNISIIGIFIYTPLYIKRYLQILYLERKKLLKILNTITYVTK